jgi:CHASE3 domain sensor protein
MPVQEKQFPLWMSEELHNYVKDQDNASAFLRGLIRAHKRRTEAADDLLDLYPNEREAIAEALQDTEIDEGRAYAPQVAEAMRDATGANVHGRHGVHDWGGIIERLETSEVLARAALVLVGRI